MNEQLLSQPMQVTYTTATMALLDAPKGAIPCQVPVPIVPTFGGGASFVRQQLGVTVTLTSLGRWPAQVGLVLMHCEPELVALVFDPNDGQVNRWLCGAAERGLMRVALQDQGGIAVVDMTCDDLIEQLRCSVALPQALDPRHLCDAVHVLNSTLATARGRQRLLIDQDCAHRVTIAVVTGAAPVGGAPLIGS